MITAHLPSGCIAARALGHARGWPLIATIAGAVMPDLDLIAFYLVDDRAFHHRRYLVHIPAFWVLASALLLIAAPHRWRPIALGFVVGWGLHILFDGVAGGLLWLWPVSDRLIALVTVPATRSHWLLSSLTHWTMLLELAIWVLAAALLGRTPR